MTTYHTAFLTRLGTTAPFPMARPTEEQHSETIYRVANRKYSAHRRIPPHRPKEYSCRRHSYSIHVPAYASGDTADNS